MKIQLTRQFFLRNIVLTVCFGTCLIWGCTLAPSHPAPTLVSSVPSADEGLSVDEIATLSSLEKLDDHPLYTMRYVGAYPPVLQFSPPSGWSCALFAALGDPDNQLYGRNFDWNHSPALFLYTDPPEGYASFSMVDIEYLGFTRERANRLLDLPLSERKALLGATALPFDGMNEMGLAVGMAAVPPGDMEPDPSKRTVGELGIIREILDHAATVNEALEIYSLYNIEMSEVPLHYLVASAAGESALVEFYQGEMVVFRNEDPWQLATNFLVASTAGKPEGECPRYDRINRSLQTAGGEFSIEEALDVLENVSQGGAQVQSSTQWSIVYNLTSGEIQVVMGRAYAAGAHALHLSLGGR
jgi:hypothetical protein